MLYPLHHLIAKLTKQRSKNPEIISYQTIRRAIGWLGISLPFVLVLGSIIFAQCSAIQPSISHYYYTNMREFFVGILCAVSLFLFSYKGFSSLDSIVSNIAGLFCLGIAYFPTNIALIGTNNYPCEEDVISITRVAFHGTIHLACAGLFFFALSMMSIFLFTKSTHAKEHQTKQKRTRNVIYVACGIIMLFSIVSIGYYFWILHGSSNTHVVFWFETLALLAFGISWLTKGEALFGDPKNK